MRPMISKDGRAGRLVGIENSLLASVRVWNVGGVDCAAAEDEMTNAMEIASAFNNVSTLLALASRHPSANLSIFALRRMYTHPVRVLWA